MERTAERTTDEATLRTLEAQLAQERRAREVLTRISQELTAELDLDRLVQRITDEATALVGAQFGAFFYNVVNEAGESYQLYTLSGAPREAFSRFPTPRNTAVFAPTFAGEGVVRSDDIRLDPRYGKNAPRRGMPEGHLPVRSYLAVPVVARSGEVLGGLFFGHREPGVFRADDEPLAVAVAAQAAVCLDNARLFGQQHRTAVALRKATEANTLLLEASALLASSLDFETTLANVVRSVVPRFADWCSLDLLEPSGEIRRIAVAHVDPAKVALADDLARRYPPKPGDPHGVPQVLRTKKSEIFEQIPDSLIDSAIDDPELRAILRGLGLRSSMCVPLLGRDAALGALSFITAESDRRYGPADLAVAEELARRSAMAIDSARLYRTARDAVAERDRALGQLRALNATLERRVDERTAQLTELNGELESFSYSVSHDLRAPVRHISGFIDLLRQSSKERLDARSERYLDTIAGAARHMGLLIDALLSFSRMGRADLARRPVPLDELVARVIRELGPDLDGRSVRWQIDPLPVVEGDPTMLRQVFFNLLANALKYSRPRAEALVEVRSLPPEAPGEALIVVRDNGVGFSMSYVHKLFGVFQRLHSDEQFEGTGIGLATARRIVQRHGGRMRAEGAEGQGASFFVSLPLAGGRP